MRTLDQRSARGGSWTDRRPPLGVRSFLAAGVCLLAGLLGCGGSGALSAASRCADYNDASTNDRVRWVRVAFEASRAGHEATADQVNAASSVTSHYCQADPDLALADVPSPSSLRSQIATYLADVRARRLRDACVKGGATTDPPDLNGCIRDLRAYASDRAKVDSDARKLDHAVIVETQPRRAVIQLPDGTKESVRYVGNPRSGGHWVFL